MGWCVFPYLKTKQTIFLSSLLYHRGAGVTDYDIISVFPQRCYDNNSHTLLSCGLTPNAALLLRTKTSRSQKDK